MDKIKFYSVAPIAFMLVSVLGLGLFLSGIERVKVPNIRTSEMVQEQVTVPDLGGVLEVVTGDGQGSCFIVARKGGWYYAITAAHVVESIDYFGRYPDFSASPDVKVGKERYPTEVVRVDSEMDVALIRFKSKQIYPVYAIARAKIGESCVTMGWSRNSFLQYKGYIVSLDYSGRIMANGGVVPGCSGGPLMNAKGEIIGVTVAFPIYRSFGFDSSSLHVPARFIEALLITIGD